MTAIAIIGRGAMGTAHAHAWNEIGLGHRIAYICAPEAGPAIAGAPAARLITDLGVILEDANVDVVSVCTPTPTHAEIAIRALEAGKNVLLEKPIALTLADAEAIRQAAALSTGMLMVAHVVRFFDGYTAVRELVDAGDIGEVLTARAQRVSSTPGASAWWHDEARSGGVLVDFAIHDFDQANLFLGRPVSVRARRGSVGGPIETAIEYEGGGLAQVSTFMGMPPGFSFASSLELLGSSGLASHRFGGALQGVSSSGGDTTVEMVVGDTRSTRITETRNPYAVEARYFLDCIEQAVTPDLVPIESAIAALTVSLAARESLASGTRVRIGEGSTLEV